MAAEPDIWSKWLLDRRSGGDPELRRKMLEGLRPIRDHVIDNAKIEPGSRVLDAGCGDGMIGFAILEKYPDAFVIFSDISEALLEICHGIATDAGWRDRCDFVLADCQDLSKIPDASVDVVTLRSVLIYVPDKLAAHREFHRVLRPGGRLPTSSPSTRSVAIAGAKEASGATQWGQWPTWRPKWPRSTPPSRVPMTR